jgi:hypothetical protein
MAFAYSNLHAIQTIPAAAGALYTLPAATKAYFRVFVLHNGNTTAETVILYKVATGGTAATANEFYKEVMIAGGTTIIEVPTPGLILDVEGDMIQGTTTTPNKVTIQFPGATE